MAHSHGNNGHDGHDHGPSHDNAPGFPDHVELAGRPRRNRKSASLRALVRETILAPSDFILPLFVM